MTFKYRVVLLLCFVFFNHYSLAVEQLNLVSETKLQEKIKTLEESKKIDEVEKTKLLESYSSTMDYLEQIKTSEEKKGRYAKSNSLLPKEIIKLESKLKKLNKDLSTKKLPDDKVLIEQIKNIPLTELEQKLASDSIKLSSIATNNSDLNQNLISESQSLAEIRQNIISATSTLEKKLDDKRLIPDNISATQKQALQWNIDAHISALRSQIKMWDQQLLSLPIRLQFMKLEKKLSDHELRTSQFYFDLLQKKVDLRRGLEIKQTQAAIRAEQIDAQGKHPLIQSLAEQNILLNETIAQKIEELSYLEARDDDVYKITKALNLEQANTKNKLEIAGLSQILGHVLYEQKKALPDQKRYHKNSKKRQALIAESGLTKIKYYEELEKIKNPKKFLEQLLVSISPDVKSAIYDDLMGLINTRRRLLEKAISIDEKYIKAISEIDFAEKRYMEVVKNYSDFLDEHLFWLRSAPLINLEIIKNIPEQIIYFLTPSKWLTFINEFFKLIISSFYILPSLIFVSLFLFKQRRLYKLLINTGIKTKRISNDSLVHTFKAIIYTLLLAAPLPVVLFIISWQLSASPDNSEFTYTIAQGMKYIVLPFFWLQTFRFMCLPGGIADVHFKWPAKMVKGLKSEMWRLMITFLPIIFITALLISKNESSLNGGLGRLALILTLITFAVFFYRIMNPRKGILLLILTNDLHGYFKKTQVLWLIFGLLCIAALIGLTLVGYVYTAGQMTISLIYTAWLIFVMVILKQISVRWILLTQRRYALKKAYEKRRLLQKKKLLEEKYDHDVIEDISDLDEPEIDMQSLSAHSSQLLNLVLFILAAVSLFTIWSDVLPAFGFFDKFTLWHHMGVVDGSEQLIPVTVWDLSLAIFIIFITIISAKRIPAIIEIIFLQRSSISSGSRYTTTTLINYSIIGLGFFTVFKLLGAEWEKLQWLFAALSVGIGFGLQEIVANFISGIIILFERPIRVGDYVSVGETEGIVSKIQIRATTILTHDRKELLVPNKEFITGQLLNWSLTDSSTRLVIPIGVAYGSNIPLARELLLEAAKEHERVSMEPVPQVLFMNFGDNTLDLQLRCFIANVDSRVSITSELNEAINHKFTAANINIAFPQRDIHLDVKNPVEIVMGNKQKG